MIPDERDLGQVLAHVHDAEIEICEGPGHRKARILGTQFLSQSRSSFVVPQMEQTI
jgi:hypothetical protein